MISEGEVSVGQLLRVAPPLLDVGHTTQRPLVISGQLEQRLVLGKRVIQPPDLAARCGEAVSGDDVLGKLRHRVAVTLDCCLPLQFPGQGVALSHRLLVSESVSTHPPLYPNNHISIAFCACSRFSAWSKTIAWGPSMTVSVISSPRCAGRQCMTTADRGAAANSASFTWKSPKTRRRCSRSAS